MSYAEISSIIFPVSKSPYWFIQVYLGLMMLSPFLNQGLAHLEISQLRPLMVAFTLFTVYSCGIGHNLCNMNGYTLGQGIYMYCLAHWLKVDTMWNRFSSVQALCMYLGITLWSALLFWRTGLLSVPTYNSVFTISASAFLFLFFTRLKMQIGLVNRMATAALGCYLLQDSIFGGMLYNWQYALSHSGKSWGYVAFCFMLCFLSFWVVSYVVTLLSNGLIARVTNCMPEKWRKAIPTI